MATFSDETITYNDHLNSLERIEDYEIFHPWSWLIDKDNEYNHFFEEELYISYSPVRKLLWEKCGCSKDPVFGSYCRYCI